MDLVMLDHEGYLTLFERSRSSGSLFLKPGLRIFYSAPGAYNRNNQVIDENKGPLRLNTDQFGGSGRRKLVFGDWDGDGDMDLMINSTNEAFFENINQEGENTYFQFRGNLSEAKLAGNTTSPAFVHWHHDGKPHLLLGAEDGHQYYYDKK